MSGNSEQLKKSFEEQVLEIIDDYGAPECIRRELEHFMLLSGNVYQIPGIEDNIINPGESLENGAVIKTKYMDGTFICSKCKSTIKLNAGEVVCDRCHAIYDITPNSFIVNTHK